MSTARRGQVEPADPPSGGALRALALRLLGGREFSRHQLRGRLLEAGARPPEVEAVLSGLAERGLLDDARVARSYAHTASRVKRRGRGRILRELAAMGIDGDLARAAVEQACDPDAEAASLEHALRRRAGGGNLAEPAVARRVFAALLRRGFEADAIRRAFARARAADPGDD